VFGRGGSVTGNVLLGGGNDLIEIEDGSGLSRIADFSADGPNDAIDVSAFFSNFGQVQAHAHQHGGDVVINLDRNDTLVLEHVTFGTLTMGDFIF
jgi:hypothetical protein